MIPNIPLSIKHDSFSEIEMDNEEDTENSNDHCVPFNSNKEDSPPLIIHLPQNWRDQMAALNVTELKEQLHRRILKSLY